MSYRVIYIPIFFFNDTATTEIYTLSLHDALPICGHALIDPVMRIVREILRFDDQRVAFPVPDRFAVEGAHDDIGVGVLATVHVDDPQAVHELADHVDRRRQLDHRDRPHAGHDDRHARGPAL